MLGEPKNQFSLTHAALSTSGRAKSDFLSVSGKPLRHVNKALQQLSIALSLK